MYCKKRVDFFHQDLLHHRHESRGCKNHIPKNRISMADIRFRVFRSETKHGTKLSRITINRHQQTWCESNTSSIKGNKDNFLPLRFFSSLLPFSLFAPFLFLFFILFFSFFPSSCSFSFLAVLLSSLLLSIKYTFNYKMTHPMLTINA